MAEGFLRSLAGDAFRVYSAGVKPTKINPYAVKVMTEEGVDLSKQKSTSAEEYKEEVFDYVVTVCDNAKATCPVYPGEYKKVHWDLKDPAEAEGPEEEILAAFRASRDKIKGLVKEFISQEK